MIISFNGDHGSGKSTIANRVAEKLGYQRYSTGQMFRDIAKEKGITLEELHGKIVNDYSVDKLVDSRTLDLSKKEGNFVIDSRMAWKIIPDSIKIYLKVGDNEAAKRIYLELKKENQRNEGKNLDSIEKVKESINRRKEMDDERYANLYGANIREEKNYDLVLDTTKLTIEEVFQKVMKFINSKK
jgi:cytidylate kinase